MTDTNSQESTHRKQLEVILEKYRKKDFSKDCGVGQRFWGKSLENFKGFIAEVGQCLTAINSEKSVFLTGATGTGKTHLAVALMTEWVRAKVSIGLRDQYSHYEEVLLPTLPVLLPSVEFFLELKDSFDPKSTTSERDIITKYSQVPLLVIDDIGAEKVSDWSRQIFYTLIDRRYRNMKQTIITSNLSLGKLSEAIDDRIASRITEMGIVVNLGAKDMRGS